LDKRAYYQDDEQDIIGEECGLCGQEAFQLVPRTVTHEVKVCPGCARRLDAQSEEQTTREALKVMGKSERRRRFQELSFEWANKFHGKRVIVYWHQRDGRGGESEHESQIRGMAYKTANAGGGWGNVKVVIDPAEHSRIELKWTYSVEWGTGKHIPYQIPIIEGQKYGLYLNLDSNDSYYILVSWGNRQTLVEDVLVFSK